MKFVPMPILKTLLLKSVISSIGDGERISHQTNAVRNATKPIAPSIIGGDNQPMREPLDTVIRKESSTAVDRAAPA